MTIKEHESLSHAEDSISENEWGELEKLSREKRTLIPENIDEPVDKKRAVPKKQEMISQARARVMELYKKTTPEKPTSTKKEATRENFLPQEQLLSAKKRRLSKYDVAERARVDRIKSNLVDNLNSIEEYQRKQIASRPNTFTKTVRLIADKLGIKTKRSEERREREAMYVALSEYLEEENAKIRAMIEREKAEALEKEREEARREEREKAEALEKEREKAKREEKALAWDMTDARNWFNQNKHSRFEKQRIQEMVERDLNSRLLTVDNLEIEVLSENPEVQKRSVPFEGVDIPIYDLKGLPFSFLSTTIDHRSSYRYGPHEKGMETSRKVLEDPSVWAERRDEAEKAVGFGTINSDARGDTISTSFWDSERNINSRIFGDLIYGFENVQADSIISVHEGDGGTSNMAGRDETKLSSPDAIKELATNRAQTLYNEVCLRRYSENGMPKRPDYIIVENGRITKESLRHAKYFGIPIVNVERSVYAEKAEKRGE